MSSTRREPGLLVGVNMKAIARDQKKRRQQEAIKQRQTAEATRLAEMNEQECKKRQEEQNRIQKLLIILDGVSLRYFRVLQFVT